MRFTAAAMLAGLCLAAPSAPAQEAKPAPTSCAGQAFVDPAGDQSTTPTTLNVGNGVPPQTIPSARKAPDNLDVTQGFFRYAPDATGKNVLTANVGITNLSKTLDTGSTSMVWYMKYRIGDVLNYAAARTDGTAVTFAYGTQSGSSLTELGTTTGKLYEGKDGIVSIVVPVAALKIEGKVLSKPFGVGAFAQGTTTGVSASLSSTADNGPDDTTKGKDFKVEPCAEGSTETPLEPVNPPATPPAPAPAPAPAPSDPAASNPSPPPAPAAGTPAAPGALSLKVVAGKQSARKITRKKKLTVRLVSSGKITDIRAKLLKGRKVVGTAKLASIDGKRTLNLKLKRTRGRKPKFKKGTYSLQITGTDGAGQRATGAVQIRVKK